MIVGAVQIICTIICMFITDLGGRKVMLLISSIGAACSTAMVAIYFHLQQEHVDVNHLTWLPTTGVLLFVVMYGLGLASIPYTLVGELFPTNVKALGSTVSYVSGIGVAFCVTKLYPVIADNVGIHVPFWIFTGCSLVGALFTLMCVPETKGKTLEQIQAELHSSSSAKTEPN